MGCPSTAPFKTGGIVKKEKLIYNSRYRFIFNHESPGHANLYIKQQLRCQTGNFKNYLLVNRQLLHF